MVAHYSSSPLPNTGTLSLLQIQLFSQVPSDVAFHPLALSILLQCTCNAQLPSLPGSLCPDNWTDWFLVPQAVSAPSTPARFQGLNSGAEVSVPSPHPSISVFGDCASSSDDLFGSHSALRNSDLLLCFSLHLEIPLFWLIFPWSR